MAMTSGIRTSWVRAITSCVRDITSPSLDQGLSADGPLGPRQPSLSPGSDATTPGTLGGLKDKPVGRRSRSASKLLHHQVTTERTDRGGVCIIQSIHWISLNLSSGCILMFSVNLTFDNSFTLLVATISNNL